MPNCTYCGEATRDYTGYWRTGTYCSPQHQSYDEKKLAGIPRTTEERNCESGQANAGYLWRPTDTDTARRMSNGPTCAYCGEVSHTYVEYYRGNTYCSHEHAIYHEKRQNGGSSATGHNAGMETEEINCRTGGSHAGYVWQR